MILPAWCHNLHNEVFDWMMRVRDPDHPGRFRYCLQGSLFTPDATTGLDASTMAMKIMTMIGCLPRVEPAARRVWVDYIRSFQRQRMRVGMFGPVLEGYFDDPLYLRRADRNKGRFFGVDVKTRRTVSRVACAALLCADSKPDFPVLSMPQTEREAIAFLEALDWERDPWDAGSHAGNLVFFPKMNFEFFGMEQPYREIVPAAFAWIDGIRNDDTGAWYKGNPPDFQKINGAMKVLTAYAVHDRPLENPEPLIDYALSQVNDRDGCHHADIIYVLWYCHRFSRHRESEMHAFCRHRMALLEAFRKPDGAFSFNPAASQKAMYGIPITKGLPESDLHGTILFMWTLTMIAEIMGAQAEVPWRMPVN